MRKEKSYPDKTVGSYGPVDADKVKAVRVVKSGPHGLEIVEDKFMNYRVRYYGKLMEKIK